MKRWWYFTKGRLDEELVMCYLGRSCKQREWWWWWWIIFVVWLTDERRLALFPAGTIVRDPYHRESPTRRDQGLNLPSSGLVEWSCAVLITTMSESQVLWISSIKYTPTFKGEAFISSVFISTVFISTVLLNKAWPQVLRNGRWVQNFL